MTSLMREFEKLEKKKDTVLSEVGGWPSEQIRFRPGAGSWSAVDVVDHLVKVERSALVAIRRQLPEGHRVGLKDRIGALVVITMMRSPIRVKVPGTTSAVLPAEAADLPDLARGWATLREDLAEMLRSLEPNQLRAGLFRHPVAGWMTIPQALMFFSVHIRHHEYQLERLRSAASKT